MTDLDVHVTLAPSTILPGGPRVDGGQHQHAGGLRDPILTYGCLGQGGALVALREVAQRIQALSDLDSQHPAPDRRKELRTLGVGAQILVELGIRKMRVMSAPISLHGLNGFDLEVVEFVDHS